MFSSNNINNNNNKHNFIGSNHTNTTLSQQQQQHKKHPERINQIYIAMNSSNSKTKTNNNNSSGNLITPTGSSSPSNQNNLNNYMTTSSNIDTMMLTRGKTTLGAATSTSKHYYNDENDLDLDNQHNNNNHNHKHDEYDEYYDDEKKQGRSYSRRSDETSATAATATVGSSSSLVGGATASSMLNLKQSSTSSLSLSSSSRRPVLTNDTNRISNGGDRGFFHTQTSNNSELSHLGNDNTQLLMASSMNKLNLRSSSKEASSSSSRQNLNNNATSSSASASTSTKTSFNKIDQLELLTTVGTGTFGRVLVVRDKSTKAYYALKIMSIAEVLRLKQTEHVKNEKEILSQVKHPFIINLYWTCHTDKFLYMLLEYVCGGELFSYLRNAVKFSNETAVFFAAEIVSALEYLHSLSIIYRDLKPENLLLDRLGHVRLCDFGFAKKVYDRTWTLCGTPEYLAPEIIVGKGHHKAVDWWALGILIYEMVVGYPPFYDDNPFQIYQKILAGKIEWPRTIDLHAKDLIKKLLTSDRTKRLGSMKNGTDDIKRHKWFKSVDWEAVVQKKLQPPIVPKVQHDGDTKNFDKYDEDNWKDVPMVSSKNLQLFEDF